MLGQPVSPIGGARRSNIARSHPANFPTVVLVRGDTTYLRHEMLHHVLQVAGWHPRQLRPGEQYTIADLHPMPLFGLCTGGH